MAATDHLGGQFTTPGNCATCGKKRKLTTYSSFDKWAGEPDQCHGCGSGRANGGTGGYGAGEVKKTAAAPVFSDDDWTSQ